LKLLSIYSNNTEKRRYNSCN